jgi:hypothetical protein
MEGKPLSPLPSGFADTVAALHLVAERLVAPARKPDNEIALEVAPGGFGTPEFAFAGARQRVRVEAAELVREVDGSSHRAPLRSLAEGGALVADLLPADAGLSDEPLAVDPDAALALGRWYGFGAAALRRLVELAGPEDEATAPRLWPEHFDLAIELGCEAEGVRANYGLSPGDESHPEPYLYVGPWTAAVAGEPWRATGFRGAELRYSELLAAPDQPAAAGEFFESRRNALNEIGRSAA